ncbi:hypothetical protein VLK31_34920 [Variovorax sp. H27-G14]|uniref:hypothetical protein n=1 Tax=Variovorax sp. H27-G14 TaxID=3111914 RepID=UPI0038FCA71D
MPAPARQFHTQQVHYLRFSPAFNTNGIAAGVQIGTLPAGAQIVDATVNVTTAFNAATTNVLAVGTTPTGAQVVTSAEAVAGTVGFKRGTAGGALSFAADTPLYCNFTQTGTAATTGAATIVIAFVPNNDPQPF